MDNYQKAFRARPSNYRLINYEAIVYKLVYGKNPPSNLRLNYRRPKKEHRNRYWDNMIDEDTIDKLMNITKIEIVDMNQGQDSKLLTHFIFRPMNQDQDFAEHVAKAICGADTKASVGIGVGNTINVYVATKNWYRADANNKTLYKWWENLPNKIKRAIG